MALPWCPLPCSFLAVVFHRFFLLSLQSFLTDQRPSTTLVLLLLAFARCAVLATNVNMKARTRPRVRMTCYLFVHCIVLAVQSHAVDAHVLCSRSKTPVGVAAAYWPSTSQILSMPLAQPSRRPKPGRPPSRTPANSSVSGGAARACMLVTQRPITACHPPLPCRRPLPTLSHQIFQWGLRRLRVT